MWENMKSFTADEKPIIENRGTCIKQSFGRSIITNRSEEKVKIWNLSISFKARSNSIFFKLRIKRRLASIKFYQNGRALFQSKNNQ